MNAFFDNLRQLIQRAAESGALPDSLAYGFVINALLAGLIIGPVLGGLGTLVVVKRFAFFSEAVGHAALTGDDDLYSDKIAKKPLPYEWVMTPEDRLMRKLVPTNAPKKYSL